MYRDKKAFSPMKSFMVDGKMFFLNLYLNDGDYTLVEDSDGEVYMRVDSDSYVYLSDNSMFGKISLTGPNNEWIFTSTEEEPSFITTKHHNIYECEYLTFKNVVYRHLFNLKMQKGAP